MKSDTVSNGFQIVASVAVIAGLGLVIWELQQTKQLARAQLASESNALAIQRVAALVGEAAPDAMMRACYEPESVTQRDAIVLDAVYQLYLIPLLRIIEVEALGGYETERLEQTAPVVLAGILSSEHGRWWWRSREQLAPPKIRDIGNRVLANPPIDCASFMPAFQSLGELPARVLGARGAAE